MDTDILIRDYHHDDANAVNATALSAFEQFSSQYDDWIGFKKRIGSMSDLSQHAKLFIAEYNSEVCGAVGYVSPGSSLPDFFSEEWASLRLLVVNPSCRGKGIGRGLVEMCISRAKQDGASVLAIHTSPIMEVALPMYLRIGFVKVKDIPEIHGVPYSIYKLALDND